jgi:hypothetical protein
MFIPLHTERICEDRSEGSGPTDVFRQPAVEGRVARPKKMSDKATALLGFHEVSKEVLEAFPFP